LRIEREYLRVRHTALRKEGERWGRADAAAGAADRSARSERTMPAMCM
jgi:hypothetical protein